MSLHSGRNFFSLTTLRDVARLDLGWSRHDGTWRDPPMEMQHYRL
ncbi:hypothetical protein BDL97_08G051800 [Sphagnum fallax]|nr:hypothetical protein BDL97_08G051800 [Sphagnum fallax]